MPTRPGAGIGIAVPAAGATGGVGGEGEGGNGRFSCRAI
jgi:hypothetical protein